MQDRGRYYQVDPKTVTNPNSSRYPKNHVRYPPLSKPIEWIDRICALFGARPFKLEETVLEGFDSAAPFDEVLGSEEELRRLRGVVESFCRNIDGNPFLHPVGRFLIRKLSVGATKKRREVLRHYHANRQFVDANGRFERPLIVTGMPRTGTTLLQRLLAEDPNSRSPYSFEMEEPLPPLREGDDPLDDPRIQSSATAIRRVSVLARGFMEKFAESHLWSATEMEESLLYMIGHQGIAPLNVVTAGEEFMNDFFDIESKRAIFRYERLFFTILDAYGSARSHWALKAPYYAVFFPLIFEEYRDANVVLTHRNPLVTLPSVCRLLESWCIAMDQDGSFDKHRFGRHVKPLLEAHMTVPLDFREEHPEKEDRIFDCVYEDLFSRPIDVVKRIYRRFDLEYSDVFEERMTRYLENNKQGKYGRHKYTLEEYDFDAESLYQEYRGYMDRFGYGVVEGQERPTSFDFGLGPTPTPSGD